MATNLSGNTLTLGSYALTGWKSGVIMVPNCSNRTVSTSSTTARVSLSIGEFASVEVDYRQDNQYITLSTTGSCILINGTSGRENSNFYGTSFPVLSSRRDVLFRVS